MFFANKESWVFLQNTTKNLTFKLKTIKKVSQWYAYPSTGFEQARAYGPQFCFNLFKYVSKGRPTVVILFETRSPGVSPAEWYALACTVT